MRITEMLEFHTYAQPTIEKIEHDNIDQTIDEVIKGISVSYDIPMQHFEKDVFEFNDKGRPLIVALRFKNQCGIIGRFQPLVYSSDYLSIPVKITIPKDLKDQYNKYLTEKKAKP